VQFPQIQITSQMGKIAIEQQTSQMNIKQPKADMTIHQPKADMMIHERDGVLTIDQTQAFEETNLFGPLRQTKKQAQAGKQAALQATQKRAVQGSQLIDIHLGGSVIAEQAKQNGYNQYVPPSITYIPSPLAVKTHYEKGKVDLDVQVQKPQIDAIISKPMISAERGGVHIAMAQQPSLSIHFENVYT